jgi:hypothetical protein
MLRFPTSTSVARSRREARAVALYHGRSFASAWEEGAKSCDDDGHGN